MDQRELRVTIEAKSLDIALVKAAGALGVTQDAIGYEVTKQAGNGLLSFFRGGAKVEITAWIKPHNFGRRGDRGGAERSNRGGQRSSGRGEGGRGEGGRGPRREGRGERGQGGEFRGERGSRGGRGGRRHSEDGGESRPAARSQENLPPSEPLTEEQITALRTELRDFCADICSQIVGESVRVTDDLTDGRLVLNLDNDAMMEMILKNSKLAEALEHILRKKPRHLRQELPFRIFIDANGSRRTREQELIEMAKDLSHKVHENKQPVVLNYKSSYDRKIIHMALDKDERVYTKSIGSGPNRKLMILPAGVEEGDDMDATTVHDDGDVGDSPEYRA